MARINYFIMMTVSLMFLFFGGNISANIFTIPTFGYSAAMIAGILTAVGAIIGLSITLRLSMLRI